MLQCPFQARLTSLECLSSGKKEIIPSQCFSTKGQVGSNNLGDDQHSFPFSVLGHLCAQPWSASTRKWGPAAEKNLSRELGHRSKTMDLLATELPWSLRLLTPTKDFKNKQAREESPASGLQLPCRVQESHALPWCHGDLTSVFPPSLRLGYAAEAATFTSLSGVTPETWNRKQAFSKSYNGPAGLSKLKLLSLLILKSSPLEAVNKIVFEHVSGYVLHCVSVWMYFKIQTIINLNRVEIAKRLTFP